MPPFYDDFARLGWLRTLPTLAGRPPTAGVDFRYRKVSRGHVLGTIFVSAP